MAHGKSTIVRQITNIRTQKHSNEQKTGRTLKLGYANVKIYRCDKCDQYSTHNSESTEESVKCEECKGSIELVNHISFVDAPGHEFLMTTMLNGTAVMDCVILVIASNESVPQPQTQEHLIATQIMDLNNIIIVQNKIDVISYDDAVKNMQSIKEWIKGTCVENSPILPVSAMTGHGIQNIIKALAQLKPSRRKPDATPIFACIRSFDVNKPGDEIDELKGGVIGGTLLQGSLQIGDEIEIRPGLKRLSDGEYIPIKSKIVGIQSEKNVLDKAIPGGLIAIGTEVDPRLTSKDTLVGSLIGKVNGLPDTVNRLNIRYFVLNNAKELIKSLAVGTKIRVTYLSRTVLGKVSKQVKSKSIEILLDDPICVFDGCDKMSIAIEHSSQWKLVAVGKLDSTKEQTTVDPDFGRELPSYTELLDSLSDCCIKNVQKKTTLKIITPIVKRQGGKRTLWENFFTIASSIGKSVEHMRKFISSEFVTSADLNEKKQLQLYGVFNEGHIESLIRRYVREYCKCNECGCYDTILQEEPQSDILVCRYCGRSRQVAKNKEHL